MSIFQLLPPRLRHPLRMEWSKLKSRGYFALNDIDRKLSKYLDYRDGFYVELGANDGQSQSNTLHLELKKGWHGVLIEPVPHRYVECQRLRGRNNAVYCAACVPFDYPETFIPMRYADLMTMTEGFTRSLDPELHFQNAQPHYDQAEAYEFAARAQTITSILDHAQAPREIDFLSLDVEGAEQAVLDGLDGYRFKYILVETKDIDAIAAQLDQYQVIDQITHHDYLLTPVPA